MVLYVICATSLYPRALQVAPAPPTRVMADLSVSTSAPSTKDFDLFISHNTKDNSHTVYSTRFKKWRNPLAVGTQLPVAIYLRPHRAYTIIH